MGRRERNGQAHLAPLAVFTRSVPIGAGFRESPGLAAGRTPLSPAATRQGAAPTEPLSVTDARIDRQALSRLSLRRNGGAACL